LDTDVNAAALAEFRWGTAQGLSDFVYVTVGTGIGGGGMVNGKLVHGLLHPEMGHMKIPHDRALDRFEGSCPYHGDCLEGLASGPAIQARWGKAPASLPPEHPAWRLEAGYLGLGLANLICVLSPQRIILGGGVMQQDTLLPLVRQEVRHVLNGYLPAAQLEQEIDSFILKPQLGQRAGVLGALALAQGLA
jgi:fructokinase